MQAKHCFPIKTKQMKRKYADTHGIHSNSTNHTEMHKFPRFSKQKKQTEDASGHKKTHKCECNSKSKNRLTLPDTARHCPTLPDTCPTLCPTLPDTARHCPTRARHCVRPCYSYCAENIRIEQKAYLCIRNMKMETCARLLMKKQTEYEYENSI